MTSTVDADSMLVIDVGTVSTRALLFDVVDGRYRFIASGVAPSTAIAPYRNVGEGVRVALDRLQAITGRQLTGADEQLMMPVQPDGSGVDRCMATISAGEPIKVLAIGLLEDISLESVHHLASTSYCRIVGSFSLNDRRRTDARINAILKLRPDLILAAGGTNGGASNSVHQIMEAVGLAAYVLPPGARPDVMFVGNPDLQPELQENLGSMMNLRFAPNLRPTLEFEQLEAAQAELARLYVHIRSQQLPGVDDLNHWAGGGLMPTATAYGWIVRYHSKAHATRKGVLGVDVGASAVTVAAAVDGNLSLSVFPQYGLGAGLLDALDDATLKGIMNWLPLDISESDLRDYLYNKAIHPDSLPATADEMAIEGALVRQAMQNALKAAARNFPSQARSPGEGLLPAFEPVIVSGSAIAQAPSLASSALMMLDGVQPTGITTMVLDQHHIVSALGAAAAVNPMLAVQVVDSNALLHLGTVITPVSNARPGTPVLRLKIQPEGGQEAALEVTAGSLEMLPLPAGQIAKLQLQPLHRADIGMGAPGRGGGLRVVGGALGLIIDARGRPLRLPQDRARRQELIKKWLWNLGGQ